MTASRDSARRSKARPRRAQASRVCRLSLRIELGLLAIQFLLGMYINLWLPHLNWQPPLIVHISVGVTLLACAVIALIASVVAREHDYLAVAATGL
jgi:hypothetical protein